MSARRRWYHAAWVTGFCAGAAVTWLVAAAWWLAWHGRKEAPE